MGGINAINDRELREAKKRMRVEVDDALTNAWIPVCDRLITDALYKREYNNLTGNTITSYTCGVYVRGKLTYFIQSRGRLDPPVRVKLRKGEYHYFDPDYDGRRRDFKGIVDTDGGFGANTAMDFLFSYKAPKRGIALVMTTGTEYSEFLEAERDKNVLTETYNSVADIMFSSFKPIQR